MAKTLKKPKRPRGRPATGVTPKRYFRMSDEEYKLVTDAAGSNVSEYIRQALLASVRRSKSK